MHPLLRRVKARRQTHGSTTKGGEATINQANQCHPPSLINLKRNPPPRNPKKQSDGIHDGRKVTISRWKGKPQGKHASSNEGRQFRRRRRRTTGGREDDNQPRFDAGDASQQTRIIERRTTDAEASLKTITGGRDDNQPKIRRRGYASRHRTKDDRGSVVVEATINRRFDSPENRELTAFTGTIRCAGEHVRGPERESKGGFIGRRSAKPRPTPKQNRSNDVYPGTA
eukprot:scaffold20454_cov40-Cyclotella_meneghiniana.AAC.1